MLGDWKEEKLICPSCKTDATFRVAYRKAQFLNGKHWDDIVKSAEIVLCSKCGASIYISTIKDKTK